MIKSMSGDTTPAGSRGGNGDGFVPAVSLRLDATPTERANTLNDILPNAMKHTQNLLDEHQTSLYTNRQADVQRARLAAFNICKHALLEAIRYIFEGRPIQDS